MLKDAQGKTIRVPSAEIERLVPQSRSLMPELLLRDLTAQQVADLLEYLTRFDRGQGYCASHSGSPSVPKPEVAQP